jgi:hypothetical protein
VSNVLEQISEENLCKNSGGNFGKGPAFRASNQNNGTTQHRHQRNDLHVLAVHPNWTALAPEASLIRHYKQQQRNLCEWNGISFGPHDPGRDRETTNKPPDGFDSQFPIRYDWPCQNVAVGERNLRELLVQIKDELPFLLRYEAVNKKYRLGHPDYNNLIVVVPRSGMPADELLHLITQQLPGWQSTRFSSHMILYKETREYTHGVMIWRQPATPAAGSS